MNRFTQPPILRYEAPVYEIDYFKEQLQEFKKPVFDAFKILPVRAGKLKLSMCVTRSPQDSFQSL